MRMQANYERVLSLVEGFTGYCYPLEGALLVPVVIASGGDVVHDDW